MPGLLSLRFRTFRTVSVGLVPLSDAEYDLAVGLADSREVSSKHGAFRRHDEVCIRVGEAEFNVRTSGDIHSHTIVVEECREVGGVSRVVERDEIVRVLSSVIWVGVNHVNLVSTHGNAICSSVPRKLRGRDCT